MKKITRKLYIEDIKISKLNKFILENVLKIFSKTFPYYKPETFFRIGRSLVFINFIFQKFFRINSSTKFMVHYTSKFVLSSDISFVDKGDLTTVFESFAASPNCYLQAYNGIIFEGGVLIAPNVKIISANHDVNDYSKHIDAEPIYIKKNVLIGAGATILPGIKIGEGSIVGSNSVVTKNVPSFTVVAGNPAKIIKKVN